MSTDRTNPGQLGKDQFKAMPESVLRVFDDHLAEYKRDPDKAHLWDPRIIGIEGPLVASLVLQHTGRKSGKALECVLQYYKRDGEIAIIGSRGGTADHPHWYLNLVAHPECGVQVERDHFKARARTLEGAEREDWYAHIKQVQPQQVEYESRTSRKIPIILLERLD
jgi:deazaflavin-dependent oxidoreductase (nitroreductase family)